MIYLLFSKFILLFIKFFVWCECLVFFILFCNILKLLLSLELFDGIMFGLKFLKLDGFEFCNMLFSFIFFGLKFLFGLF